MGLDIFKFDDLRPGRRGSARHVCLQEQKLLDRAPVNASKINS